MPPSEPEDLKRLGDRIEAASAKIAETEKKAAPSSAYSIAVRLGAEMVSAVVVGAGLGWGIDWAFTNWAHFQTRPVFMVVMFFLGAAAGIRMVIRTAQQISAGQAPRE